MGNVDIWYFVSVLVTKRGEIVTWTREIREDDGRVVARSQLINGTQHDNPFLPEAEV